MVWIVSVCIQLMYIFAMLAHIILTRSHFYALDLVKSNERAHLVAKWNFIYFLFYCGIFYKRQNQSMAHREQRKWFRSISFHIFAVSFFYLRRGMIIFVRSFRFLFFLSLHDFATFVLFKLPHMCVYTLTYKYTTAYSINYAMEHIWVIVTFQCVRTTLSHNVLSTSAVYARALSLPPLHSVHMIAAVSICLR